MVDVGVLGKRIYFVFYFVFFVVLTNLHAQLRLF